MNSSSGFFGSLLRQTVRALVGGYYRHIEVAGRDLMPSSGPVLIVANHANSLFDPVLIGIAVRRPVHFLAKAPLFETPVIGPLMRAMGMIPAYRGVDDPKQTRRNTESLASGASFLKTGGVVGIFPEGKSHDFLRVEQVKSGAARIAQQAVEAGVKDLKILPIGLNYECKERFRTGVWIQIGSPIDASAWFKTEDPHKAMRELSREIDEKLRKLVIHLENAQWETYLLDLEALLPRFHHVQGMKRLRMRKQMADAMNAFIRTHPERSEQIGQRLKDLHQKLEKAPLSIHSPLLREKQKSFFGRHGEEWLRLILWSAPAVVGTLYHVVPFILGRILGSFVRLPGKTTTALTRLGVGIPIFLLWYAFSIWYLGDHLDPFIVLTWHILLPLFGLSSLQFWRQARVMNEVLTQEFEISLKPAVLGELRKDFQALSRELDALAGEYLPSSTP